MEVTFNKKTDEQSPNKKRDKPELTIKIITIGNSSVGKTALIMRYFDGQFTQNPMSTTGVITKF